MQSSCVLVVHGTMNTFGCPGVGSIGTHARAGEAATSVDMRAVAATMTRRSVNFAEGLEWSVEGIEILVMSIQRSANRLVT